MYLCDLVLHVFLFLEVLTVDTESAAAITAQEPEIQPEPEPAVPSAKKAVESGTKCFDPV